MKTLAVIPARGGSKGLPGKNARPFLGVPLLARAIHVGLQTCDEVVVTTDSPELAELARNWSGRALSGNPLSIHMRPAELATDEAPMLPVVQDAIRGREGDVIVLLQPTQPLRTVEQVRLAIGMLETRWSSVVSVRRVPKEYSPDRVLVLSDEELRLTVEDCCDCGSGGDWFTRRQDARQAYVRDGTVYVFRRRHIPYTAYGPRCRPMILEGDALSIDTPEDFERLEALARQEIIREDLAKEA